MLSDKFQTLVEALLAAAPERPFVTMWRDEDDVQTITFGEFIRAAKSQAADFRAGELQPGDRVILIMPQDISLMVAFAGAMMAGAVPAILAYPNFKVDPTKYASGLLGTSENLKARLIIVDKDFPVDLLAHVAKREGAEFIRSASSPQFGAEASLAESELDPDGVGFIQHSAGTTGLQKGVALSHRAVLTQLDHLAIALELDERDRIYSWLPLYHDMGLIACYMLPLACHLPVVMQSATDWVLRPQTMLQLIGEYRCTLAWTPNFALQFLARRVRPEDADRYDLSCLRALINCSEPIRARSMDEFQVAYAPSGLKPDALKSCYAMAENVFAVTQSAIRGLPHRISVSAKALSEKCSVVTAKENSEGGLCLVSSGRCLPGNQVRIASRDGTALPDGKLGEILIQSDSLFGGYYNRPDLTAKAIQDGWYWSGDLGFTLEGELYVVGRKNDLIIVAGKNIYPQDIEEVVSRHPAIHDGRAVAFGLYNSDLGTDDIIVVAETESEKELTAAGEIERVLRNAIAAELDVAPRAIYLKPPRWIVKSTAGKPARATTREKLLMEDPELVEEEHEHLFEMVKDSVMTRTIEGKIEFWNRRAEELYGWSKEEAIGKVSHSLLQTQFPEPLEQIEATLLQTGRWEGALVHATREGRRVVVQSRWKLKKRCGAVVEINRQPPDFYTQI